MEHKPRIGPGTISISDTETEQEISNKPDSPLDETVLDSIRALQQDDMPDILSELIEIYLKESERLIRELSLSVENSDAEGMARSAHSLKSSSGNMGAMVLSGLCKDMEENGRRQKTANAAEEYPRLFAEYQRVQTALKVHLGKKAGNHGNITE